METAHPIKETQSRRQEMAALALQLYQSQERAEVMCLLRLLDLLLERAKDNLLDASPVTFAPLQGEAFAYRDLKRMILTKPLPKD